MKWFLLSMLLVNASWAKTYFIDPLANIVPYDVTSDRTVGLFESAIYNQELISSLDSSAQVFIFNEFSGLGDLDLSDIPNSIYLAPPRTFMEWVILKPNDWGWVKTDDFFLNLDSLTFSVFTWHPFSKRDHIISVLEELPKDEEIIVITTTWKSGEALYKNLLADRKNVKYLVRDLDLNKTLYPKPGVYNLVGEAMGETIYRIFDSRKCNAVINLEAQARYISSRETFKQKNYYSEGNKREGTLVAARIAQYMLEQCDLNQ